MKLSSEYADFFSERSSLYAFLSRIYLKELDEDFLKTLRSLNFEADKNAKGYRLITNFLNNGALNPLLELARDYARIFLGASLPKNSAAFPYESVFTSPDGLMEGEAFFESRKIYAREGLVKPDEVMEPNDHIAFELEFMKHLAKKSCELLKTGGLEKAKENILKEKDFLNNHLLNWVEKFCGRVLKWANTDFYKGAAIITIDFLKEDREFLEELLNYA